MNIFVFCQHITATQQMCFGFDQSLIVPNKRIKFNIISHQYYKYLEPQARKNLDQIIYRSDGIVFSRWYLEPAFRILEKAKTKRVPVIFHIDDLLDSVPKSLGIAKYNYYSDPEMLRRFRLMIETCDHVVCSTAQLKNRLAEKYSIRSIHQIPVHSLFSSCRNSTTDLFSSSSFRPYPVIGYMGSSSHLEDLDSIVDSLLDVMERYSLLRFETCGVSLPTRISNKFPSRTRKIGGVQSYWQFREYLKTLGWWAGLAPLTNSEFNSCKSDTKIVEYIQAGIPVLASGIGPYEGLPLIARCLDRIYPNDWSEKMGRMIESYNYRRSSYEACYEYCSAYDDFEKVVSFYRQLFS